jgi:eukaryotic-like serine/threonine-protein kinase
MIGKTFSHYTIVTKLGSGGMGVVYKARDLQLERFVALKFLPEGLVKSQLALERFHREARSIASIDHPNICSVYDFGEYEGRPFIAMQLLEGHNLRDVIFERPLRTETLIEYGIQIAEGLDRAHSKGLIHRDIKPANIFITGDGLVKILDFGLAKSALNKNDEATVATADNDDLTSPGAVLGTVSYMSPEQASGVELDTRTDLFSFGAVLFEMATGQRAFTGKTNATIFDSILNRVPSPPSTLNALVPSKLEQIIVKALDKDRETRYQTAAEIRADLKRFKKETESVHLAATSSAARPHSRFSRKWLLGGVAVAAFGAVLGGLIYRNREGSDLPGLANQRLTQLFSSTQAISDPALSPDGKTIVYAEYDSGQWDLFASRIAGGPRVRLTNDGSTEEYPRFSPDGEHILFERTLPQSSLRSAEICITSVFGGDVTPLIADGSSAEWSPDGQRLAFIRGGREVIVADKDGRNARTLMRTDTTYIAVRNLAWSPDGSQIAVDRSMGGISGEIWLVSAGSGQPRRLWRDPPEVYSHNPVFTPDGSAIIHSSNRGGATNLWLLFLNGQTPARLTTGPGPDEAPSVARDGTIAFVNRRSRHSLFVYDVASSKSRALLNHSGFLWAPSFSPDGDDITFSRAEADGSWHIWIASIKTGAAQRLTSGPVPEIYSHFTPDGKSIIYNTWSAQPDRVWKVPRAGGVPVPITPAREDDDAYADISPDGKLLAFARTEGDVTRVYVAPVEGGEARLLTRTPSTVPRWSPDGKRIAFSPRRTHDGGIFVISADGSNERQLTKSGGWPVWWPDGKRIAFLNVSADGNQHVNVVTLDAESTTVLPLEFNGNNFPIDLFSKNLLVTTNAEHISTDVWVLSNKPVTPAH